MKKYDYKKSTRTPRNYSAMTMMVGGAAFVWVTPILPLLNGQDPLIPMDSTQISWMVSLVEVGSACSTLFSGYIAEHCGRKEGILFGGPFLIIGWIMILLTRDSFSLYIVRFLHGLSMGSYFTIIPIYLGEIAAVKVRGSLTSLMQTLWYTGFLFQYIIGSYLSYQNSALVNLVLSTAVFTFFYLTQPETPFYLLMKNKENEARKSLMLLRGKKRPDDVTVELKQIKDNIDNDMKSKSKFSDIFNLSSVDYKIMMTVQLVTIHRLCSGTISISTYMNDILREANWQTVSPELTMTIYGTITLIMIVIATLLVDCAGRRPLLILSSIGSTISNLMLAGFFYISEYHKEIDIDSVRWLPALSLVMFAMFLGIGLGPVTQTLQSELFPTNIRALGNVVTNYNATFTSFILLRFYQIVIDYMGLYANFLLFSLNTTISIFVFYKCIPETKGKTFLEIRAFYCKNYGINKPKTQDTRL